MCEKIKPEFDEVQYKDLMNYLDGKFIKNKLTLDSPNTKPTMCSDSIKASSIESSLTGLMRANKLNIAVNRIHHFIIEQENVILSESNDGALSNLNTNQFTTKDVHDEYGALYYPFDGSNHYYKRKRTVTRTALGVSIKSQFSKITPKSNIIQTILDEITIAIVFDQGKIYLTRIDDPIKFIMNKSI